MWLMCLFGFSASWILQIVRMLIHLLVSECIRVWNFRLLNHDISIRAYDLNPLIARVVLVVRLHVVPILDALSIGLVLANGRLTSVNAELLLRDLSFK